MNLEDYLTKHFPALELKRPLFYNHDIGIRFEIGDESIDIFTDEKRNLLNTVYFTTALERATKLFETIFEKDDEIIFICQRYSDGRQKIKKRSYCFQNIHNLSSKKIEYLKIGDIYHYEFEYKKEHWHRIAIHTNRKEINYLEILKRLIFIDFGGHGQTPEAYFINTKKNIIYNLYDDRGLDIIAKDKEALTAIYKKFNSWILNYDREKIDVVFKDL